MRRVEAARHARYPTGGGLHRLGLRCPELHDLARLARFTHESDMNLVRGGIEPECIAPSGVQLTLRGYADRRGKPRQRRNENVAPGPLDDSRHAFSGAKTLRLDSEKGRDGAIRHDHV